MSESNVPVRSASGAFLPRAILVPLIVVLFALFAILLFPWDALGRRVAWEINRVSAAQVEVNALSPALTARGPVLRANDVSVRHPAVDQIRIFTLEIAPRFSTSWFSGAPTLRIWAETGLGTADGVFRLGEAPAYEGRVSNVELSRLPLRLDTSNVQLAGRLDADADVALDPGGTLRGRVEFESPSLRLQTSMLPVQIPFTRTTGVVEILESGATRISEVVLEGDVVSGTIEGEIGLVHRSQSPPLDLRADLRVRDETLKRLAPSAGLRLGPEGALALQVSGTVASPKLQPSRARPPGPGRTR
ncbi:MAG: type II secretion system protein GspN [Myxococcota bacterium]